MVSFADDIYPVNSELLSKYVIARSPKASLGGHSDTKRFARKFSVLGKSLEL